MTDLTHVQTNVQQESFWSKHGKKLIALSFWLALIGGYALYANANDLTVQEAVRNLAALLTGSTFGVIIYIAIYALRPILFFPATLITLLAGFLFGPVVGIIATVLGSNSSAMVAYIIGRYFGGDLLNENEEDASLIKRYTGRLRENSFEAVLLMRLLFLPYDLVNYLAGFLRIDWKAFLLATIIGSIPGTISFVLLGTSFGTLDDLLSGEVSLNPIALGLSIILIAGSIALSRYLKKRETKGDEALV